MNLLGKHNQVNTEVFVNIFTALISSNQKLNYDFRFRMHNLTLDVCNYTLLNDEDRWFWSKRPLSKLRFKILEIELFIYLFTESG